MASSLEFLWDFVVGLPQVFLYMGTDQLTFRIQATAESPNNCTPMSEQ